MRIAHLSILFAAFMLPSCTSEASTTTESGKPTEISNQLVDLLEGIKDGETATAAKERLSSLTDQLGRAMNALKSGTADATNKAKELGEGVGGALEGATEKTKAMMPAGLTSSFSEIQNQISRLMDMENVRTVIGPTLGKLKGLVSAG